ncbi:Uncharacterized conserved protein encoded by sequence overlapping the COX4 gene [Plasmopara halstedii]|uniref:Uncharacterized conserved protein encoded by sequence overlapping the COX4 protein n=1 Tax=Plasmopara halstedii TaxID=4781 RepID=A0A0P1AH00_PLAHL|nr:Uncharacterized conserved protein encoded by sequence overlapping the COX4 gene [Plasmopara halstedii]CEG39993.1 Uncharacterized conserved protein encoded by sequence overlapping the COX4 gene [Plasmopara halstedii]|eukprot:XP_024576362.1 Uncharacterized conserved protein encoded by sequence overlapping the COX4 gene [Plasmopara halstedii]
MDYSVSTQSYVKLALHAAKHPSNAVCGLLIGVGNGNRVLITDAVPLFHHEAPLAPLFEVACAMVDAHYQIGQKMQIVGFYYAGSGHLPSESGNGLSHFAHKVAEKVEQNYSRACVLLLDNQQLNSEATTGIQLLLKDIKRGWTKMENRLNVADGATKVLTQGLKQNVQNDVVDIDEHFEIPSKDWRNLHIAELLKLNV